MADNTDITDNLSELEEAQNSEQDNRAHVREADHFLNKRDGQWDPYTSEKMTGKPKYTLDQCNPIIDDITGEMASMDFAITVNPAGGDASKKTAEQYGGVIRNIENISGARYTYQDSGRVMTGTGLSGWRIKQDFRDSDSFQQDLLIDEITNFKDRVWFDSNAVKRTMEDAMKCWVLTEMTRKKYDILYPKGSGTSVGDDKESQAYQQKKSNPVVIGEYLYRKKAERTLVLMSNNAVYVVDDDFEKIREELLAQDIKVERERKRDVFTVYQRLFDGSDWLTDDKKTVFEYIPVVPAYANFTVSDNKIIYWGAVEKFMDPQRIINFAESRKVEEAALSPREKVWITKDMAKSSDVRKTLRTANTNQDSHQIYDDVPNGKMPFKPQANQVNQVLIETANSANRYMARSLPDEMRGVSTPGRSGVAINALQNKGDNSNYKYFTAMEIAIAHTCRILIKAIPKVYDTKQEMRLIGQDGTVDTITIKDQVFDDETQENVEINDLSKGQYDVTCSAGAAFSNRQQETVQAMLDIAAISPALLDKGSDIMVRNVNAPDMDKLAERLRIEKVQTGQIPESQLTEDEKEMLAAQSEQANQPSAVDQALMAEAQARTQEVEAKTADTLSRMEERQNKFELEVAKFQQSERQTFLKAQNEQQKLQQDNTQMMINAIGDQSAQLKEMAETFKILREGQGVDVFTGPGIVDATINQTELIEDKQESVEAGTLPI